MLGPIGKKPSGIAAKEMIARVHLVPLVGDQPLDRISTERVQGLKSTLVSRTPKTVNNVLAYLVVLLGGEAGLRRGEIAAIQWADVDLKKRQLCVQRSVWKGHTDAPKGGRLRYVPLTSRVVAALQSARHLRGSLVFCDTNGNPLNEKIIADRVDHSARAAGLKLRGVHALRHSFCSHLAMRGAPARAIQELAGHADLRTTHRYMHLSPAALDAAIRLLDSPGVGRNLGEILESTIRQDGKSSG